MHHPSLTNLHIQSSEISLPELNFLGATVGVFGLDDDDDADGFLLVVEGLGLVDIASVKSIDSEVF